MRLIGWLCMALRTVFKYAADRWLGACYPQCGHY
jgi:hypothetical protein